MKKTTKRKMYQRRRKKEKAEQRKNTAQANFTESTATATTSKNNHKKKPSIPNQQNLHNFYPTNCNHQQLYTSNRPLSIINSYSKGLQLWWQTYCSAIEFYCQQNACKNDRQKQQLEKYANEYETSSEEEDNREQDVTVKLESSESNLDEMRNDDAVAEDVDEEYLKFLEITHKHREELRLKRAQENI